MLDLLVLGLVCIAAPWFARMAGYEVSRKPFDLVGIAGVCFLLGASLFIGMGYLAWLKSLGAFILSIPYVAGILLLALGAIWGTVVVLLEPGHGLLMKKV